MAHYALLDKNNVVVNVITGRDEDEIVDGISDWEAYYSQETGYTAVRTSYNTKGNAHIDGGTAFRGNYAIIGGTFDSSVEPDGVFIGPKPFPSWVLNTSTFVWESPVEDPNQNLGEDENSLKYVWIEETLEWVNVEERRDLFPVEDLQLG
jgi:hypothetical protein